MSPADCESCDTCHTTLARYPDEHRDPVPHELEVVKQVRKGEFVEVTQCRRCHKEQSVRVVNDAHNDTSGTRNWVPEW